jgi:hypothetical protein
MIRRMKIRLRRRDVTDLKAVKLEDIYITKINLLINP